MIVVAELGNYCLTMCLQINDRINTATAHVRAGFPQAFFSQKIHIVEAVELLCSFSSHQACKSVPKISSRIGIGGLG